MIADDRVADNTDVYAFRSPTNPDKVIIIANYIPGQLPQDGPNYHHFSEDVLYEIHIDNDVATKGDDITYRFRFKRMNEDPTTFFPIRLGKENLKTTYTLERKMNGGGFQTIVSEGTVPPPNVGPRAISSAVGLKAPDYQTLMKNAIRTASTGERVFAGTIEDPFFVDIGGISDLGDAPRMTGSKPMDGLKCLNVSTLTLEVDISTLQKSHQSVSMATNILDPNYVIGVWASASRQKIRVLNGDGTKSHSGEWVQVSRLGMPLTNEAVIPIGYKDKWNSSTPYDDLANIGVYGNFFYNPELALYMDDALFGPAVPSLKPLRIQKNSLGEFGFGNTQDGLYGLKNTVGVQGTALSEANFGGLLLPGPGKPRSVDLYPIFHTGVPNLPPYQLATMKGSLNPFVPGKPFINNFLPNGGDMLRLNMAVPVTPRNSADFSQLGLVQAAVLGLTDARFNTTRDIQNIPNMDGFPNGRRLEDDVVRIELQAVSGVVLAAIGFWYDDYQRFVTPSPVTPQLLGVLGYTTGVDKNDKPFQTEFPFVQKPNPGNGPDVCDFCVDGDQTMAEKAAIKGTITTPGRLGMATPEMMITTQNPVVTSNTIRYRVTSPSQIQIMVMDASGKLMKVLVNKKHDAGTYTIPWNTSGIGKGSYFIIANKNGVPAQSVQVIKN